MVDVACARRGPKASVPFITSRDLWVLRATARSLSGVDAPIGRALAEKLEHCLVLPPGASASGIVTLGSHVVLDVGGRPAQERVLVNADECGVPPRLVLPVATPLGVAVLWSAAGSSATFQRRDGGVDEVRIIAILNGPMNERLTVRADDARPQMRSAAEGELAVRTRDPVAVSNAWCPLPVPHERRTTATEASGPALVGLLYDIVLAAAAAAFVVAFATAPYWIPGIVSAWWPP